MRTNQCSRVSVRHQGAEVAGPLDMGSEARKRSVGGSAHHLNPCAPPTPRKVMTTGDHALVIIDCPSLLSLCRVATPTWRDAPHARFELRHRPDVQPPSVYSRESKVGRRAEE
jgi:hypothetical protein